MGFHVTLRERLRQDLAGDHDRLDQLVSTFDLTTVAGLGQFLSMHAMGVAGIAREGHPADVTGVMEDLIARAQADLAVLGLGVPDHGADAPALQVDGLALRYVLGGAQMGTAVLRRRWAAASDPQVRAASAFFGGARHADLWNVFLAEVADHAATGPCADRIVADGRRLFVHFHHCATDQMNIKVVDCV